MSGEVLDHEHNWEPAGAVLRDGWRIVWYCDDEDCWAWTMTEQSMEHYVELDRPGIES